MKFKNLPLQISLNIHCCLHFNKGPVDNVHTTIMVVPNKQEKLLRFELLRFELLKFIF